jgi:hypothetical protein
MKVQAIACDVTTCDSVARGGENGVPASWLTVNVTQGGRKVMADNVFCSRACLVTYVRAQGDVAPRRRRSKEQIAADEAAAAAAAAEPATTVPEPGTEA